MKKSFLSLCIIVYCTSFSQNNIIDSLNGALKNANEDSLKITLLLDLAEEMNNADNSSQPNPKVTEAYQKAVDLLDPGMSIVLKHNVYHMFGGYYLDKMYLNEGMAWWRKDSAVISKEKDRDMIEWSYCHLAMAYHRMNENAAAERLYMSALKIAEEDKDTNGILHVIDQMAILYNFSENRIAKAMECEGKMLKLYKLRNDSFNLGRLYGQIGRNYYFKTKNFNRSLYYLNLQLELAKESTNQWGMAGEYGFAASVMADSGNYREAVKFYEKAIEAGKKANINAAFLNLSALTNLVDCYVKLKDFDEAKKVWNEIFELSDEAIKKYPDDYGFSENKMASIYLQHANFNEILGNKTETLNDLNKSARLSEKINLRNKKLLEKGDTIVSPLLVQSYSALGKVYLKLGKTDSAEKYLRIALLEGKLFKEAKLEVEIVNGLWQIDSVQGKTNSGFRKEYQVLEDSLKRMESREMLANKTNYQLMREAEAKFFIEVNANKNFIGSGESDGKINHFKLWTLLCLVSLFAASFIVWSRK